MAAGAGLQSHAVRHPQNHGVERAKAYGDQCSRPRLKAERQHPRRSGLQLKPSGEILIWWCEVDRGASLTHDPPSVIHRQPTNTPLRLSSFDCSLILPVSLNTTHPSGVDLDRRHFNRRDPSPLFACRPLAGRGCHSSQTSQTNIRSFQFNFRHRISLRLACASWRCPPGIDCDHLGLSGLDMTFPSA
jgi:hypothetical protein